MQIRLLSLLVIIPLLRSVAFGMIMNMALLIGSVVLTGIIGYVNDYPAAMIYSQPEIE